MHHPVLRPRHRQYLSLTPCHTLQHHMPVRSPIYCVSGTYLEAPLIAGQNVLIHTSLHRDSTSPPHLPNIIQI